MVNFDISPQAMKQEENFTHAICFEMRRAAYFISDSEEVIVTESFKEDVKIRSQ